MAYQVKSRELDQGVSFAYGLYAGDHHTVDLFVAVPSGPENMGEFSWHIEFSPEMAEITTLAQDDELVLSCEASVKALAELLRCEYEAGGY